MLILGARSNKLSLDDDCSFGGLIFVVHELLSICTELLTAFAFCHSRGGRGGGKIGMNLLSSSGALVVVWLKMPLVSFNSVFSGLLEGVEMI